MSDDDVPAGAPVPPPDGGGGPAAPVGGAEPGIVPVVTEPEVVALDGTPVDSAPETAPDTREDTTTTARLAGVEAALAALAHRHDGESERAAARERVIERQHADIERMRTDERFGVLRPVLVDLCRLRNDLLRQAGALGEGYPVEKMTALLESFAASVEDALLRCGVDVLAREVGTPFDPRSQNVAKVVEVDDPERDGTVAAVVQDGYAEVDGGRVVVPARVAVHRMPPPARRATADDAAAGNTAAGDTTAASTAQGNMTKEHVNA